VELEDFRIQKDRDRSVKASPDILRKVQTRRRLRPRTFGGGDGAAAIVATAAGTSNNKLGGIGDARLVAVMRRFADATCMRRRRGYRHRQRNKVSRQREKQQQSGGQAMHGFRESGTSRFGRG
jgi:hypothetical protein